MRLLWVILASLALSGCALLHHDTVVRSVFPEDDAFATGIPVPEDWAQ